MDLDRLTNHFNEVLKDLDPDYKRNGLLNTPKRVAQAYQELTRYSWDKDSVNKHFVFFKSDSDNQLVVVSNIFYSSLCEHHLLPYFGHISIGYIPDGRVLGLSKFKRIVDAVTKQLSVQEELSQEIFDLLMDKIKPQGLILKMEGKHTCSLIRGAKDEHSVFSVIKYSNHFLEHPEKIDHFFRMIQKGERGL